MFKDTHTYMHIYRYLRAHTCVNIYTYTYIHTHTSIYTHIYTHMVSDIVLKTMFWDTKMMPGLPIST